MLFLLILDWSLLESLGRSVGPDRYATCTKKGGLARGVSSASPMAKSVSFLRKGKRLIADGFVIT